MKLIVTSCPVELTIFRRDDKGSSSQKEEKKMDGGIGTVSKAINVWKLHR